MDDARRSTSEGYGERRLWAGHPTRQAAVEKASGNTPAQKGPGQWASYLRWQSIGATSIATYEHRPPPSRRKTVVLRRRLARHVEVGKENPLGLDGGLAAQLVDPERKVL